MAATKAAGSDVKHVVDSDGDHHIGVVIGGHFVPFVTVPGVHVADRVEAAKSPEAQAASGTSSEDEG